MSYIDQRIREIDRRQRRTTAAVLGVAVVLMAAAGFLGGVLFSDRPPDPHTDAACQAMYDGRLPRSDATVLTIYATAKSEAEQSSDMEVRRAGQTMPSVAALFAGAVVDGQMEQAGRQLGRACVDAGWTP